MIGRHDPRHGTDRGYHLGCREACCRAGHAAAARAHRVDPNRLVDIGPTRRRVEALGCRGWSRQALSLRLGRHCTYLSSMLLNHDQVTTSTAAKVVGLYDELHDLDCTEPMSTRTRNLAARCGYVPPAGWLDIDRGLLGSAHVPEKFCGCHPYMPNEWTAEGYQCMGCGFGISRARLAEWAAAS